MERLALSLESHLFLSPGGYISEETHSFVTNLNGFPWVHREAPSKPALATCWKLFREHHGTESLSAEGSRTWWELLGAPK